VTVDSGAGMMSGRETWPYRRNMRWSRPPSALSGLTRPADRAEYGSPVPPPADLALAAGLLVLLVLPWTDPYLRDGGPGRMAPWAALAALGAGALAWRRSRPRTVWAVATVVAAVLMATRQGDSGGTVAPLLILLGPLVALWTVVCLAPRRRGLVGMGLTLVALEVSLAGHPRVETHIYTAVLVIAAWALGDGARSRWEYERAMAERASAEERARVVGELHDIMVRQLDQMAAQAGTARMLAESGRAPEPELLAGLEAASRQAMSELKLTLGVPGSPRPGLDRLPVLIDRLAPTGLLVHVSGRPGDLPSGIDLAAYRVVQEGLTNVLRHSRSRHVWVELRRSPGALTVAVLDEGPSRDGRAAGDGRAGHDDDPGQSGGHGLAGLRERAATHGGWLEAGPRPGGGFQLRAHLPLQELALERVS
jgi:signal transduction histidine kinase